MNESERAKILRVLTRILSDEIELQVKLEIISILDPDAKFMSSDPPFIVGKLN